MARSWHIYIPVRPKAVQSVRGGRNGFYADSKVRKWKAAIKPYIEKACSGGPTELPLQITQIRYEFKYPQSTPKNVARFIDSGGIVPYIGTADITDNLAKGVIDTCAGLVFVNDKQIWHTCNIMKLYKPLDGIYIEFEETPEVILIDGKLNSADGMLFA